MPSTSRSLALIGMALGLVVVVYVGGKFAMSETSLVDEPAQPPAKPATGTDGKNAKQPDAQSAATVTFGNGCFWCTEAVFQRLKGVKTVVSGYSGGHVKHPTYQQVCTGATGHAEAIQITYDPKEISFDDLLAVFWYSHDPTTKDRQGNDVGTQYRSVIFYHSDEQKQLAEKYKKKLDESGIYRAPIVTEIVPFTEFFPAEDYHQNYYNQNSGQPYCRAIIGPKVEKLKKAFKDKLKSKEAHP
jgi:peptide-methionine (S)-S-oxide reductase